MNSFVNQSTKRKRGANFSRAENALDPKVVKAIAHPLRHRILMLLADRVASPSELATELDEPLGNVAYHVRTLLDLGCIELVRTAPRRGALEHYYRALVRPFFSDEDWSQLPIHTRNAVMDQTLGSIVHAIADAAVDGGFDRSDVHASRTPLEVDAEGYEEIASMLSEVLARALEIQAECAGRHADHDGDSPTIAIDLVMLHFERGEPRGRPRKRRGRAT